MDVQDKALSAKTGFRTAEGMGLEKTITKVGAASIKDVEYQPVTDNQSFATKGLAFRRVTEGY